MDPQIEAWISELELGEFVDQLRAEGLIDTKSLAALSELDIETFAHASGMRLGAKARLRKLCDRCRTEGNTGAEQVQLELTEGDAELVNGLPTPLARAFREVLRRSPATTTNDDVRRALDVLLRFLALVCYADYLHTRDWQDPSINERFLKLQDLGSLGSWREFIDAYVRKIKVRTPPGPFLRELPDVWRRSEHDKPVSIARDLCDKYGRPITTVNRLGRVEWLINRRNHLTHDHIHSGDADAAQENRARCIELFREFKFLCRYELWAGSSSRAFLLRGFATQNPLTAPPPVLGDERDVVLTRTSALSPPERHCLPLPPLMLEIASLPGGAEQESRRDGEVVILDVIRGNIATYRIPVPNYSLGSEREVGRIRLLAESKEFATLRRDQLDPLELCRRIDAATDRTFRVLKSSGKFDPELHVRRSGHELRLHPWIDSTIPLLGISADAGSGKTGIISNLAREWRRRPDKAVLFLLASQYQDVADLDRIIQRALALDEDTQLVHLSESLGGLVIVLDGINEHPSRHDVIHRIRIHADHALGTSTGTRFAVTWRSEDEEWMAKPLARPNLWWTPEETAHTLEAARDVHDDDLGQVDLKSGGPTDISGHASRLEADPDHSPESRGQTSQPSPVAAAKVPARPPTRDRKCYVRIGRLTDEECAEVWRRYQSKPELRMSPRFEWAALPAHNPGLADRLRSNPLEMRLTMRCLDGKSIRDVHDEMHVFADYLDGVRQEFRAHRVADLLDTLGSLLYERRTIRFTRDDLRNSCAELIEPKDGVSALIVLEDEGIVTSLDRKSYTFAIERLAEQIIGERLAREPVAESGATLAAEASRLAGSKFAQAHGVIQVALDQRMRALGDDEADRFLFDFIDRCAADLAGLASLALERRALDMGDEGAETLAAWLLERPSEADVEAALKASQRLVLRGRHTLACALLRPFLHEPGHDGASGPLRHAQLASEFVACAADALDDDGEDLDGERLLSDVQAALRGLRDRARTDPSSEGLRLLGRALLAASEVDASVEVPWDRAALGEEAIEACRRRVALCEQGQHSDALDDAHLQLARCLHRVGTSVAESGDDSQAEKLFVDALCEGARIERQELWDPSPTQWHMALLCERQERHDRRLDHLRRCLAEELMRQRWDHAAITHSEIGDALISQGKESEGVMQHFEAVSFADRHAGRRRQSVARERLGDTLQGTNRLEEALEAYEQSFRVGMTPHRISDWYPAVSLSDSADVLGKLGRWDEAIERRQQSIGAWREDGNRRGIAIELELLGDALRETGRLEDALSTYADAYREGMTPERAERWSPAPSLMKQARVLRQLKRLDDAISCARDAADVHRADGNRRSLAVALERLGDTLRQAERLDEALNAYEESYTTGMNPEPVEDWRPAIPLSDAADVLGEFGRWEEAIERRRLAIEAWRKVHNRRGVAIELELLGDALRETGRLQDALNAYEESYTTGMNPEPVEDWHPAIPLSDAADALGELGRWEEAIERRHLAIEAWRKVHNRRGIAIQTELLGDALRETGRLEDALSAYMDAHREGMTPERAESWSPAPCLIEQARVLGLLERWDDAISCARDAVDVRRGDGNRGALAFALERLGDTLRQAERLDEAFNAYEESYETGMRPEPFEGWRPAIPLSDAADVLGELGRWDEAIERRHLAIEAWRKVHNRRGIAIEIELLGDALRETGRLEDALSAYMDAHREGMTPERAESWSPAPCLIEQARVLGLLERWDDAISCARDAVDVRRGDGNRGALAFALERLGDTLRQAERLDEAFNAYEESYKTGMHPEPVEDWSPAIPLSDAADVLGELGRWEEAIERRHMAIEAWRKVHNRRGVAIELELLGDAFRESQRIDDALAAYAESYREGMTPHQAERWRPASCLRERAELLLDLGRSDEAVEVLRTAISHAETDRATPPSFADDCMLLMLTCALGRALHAIGSSADALESMHAARPVAESCYSDSDADDACVEAAAKWWSTEAAIWRALGGTHEADESELRARALAARVPEAAP